MGVCVGSRGLLYPIDGFGSVALYITGTLLCPFFFFKKQMLGHSYFLTLILVGLVVGDKIPQAEMPGYFFLDDFLHSPHDPFLQILMGERHFYVEDVYSSLDVLYFFVHFDDLFGESEEGDVFVEGRLLVLVELLFQLLGLGLLLMLLHLGLLRLL